MRTITQSLNLEIGSTSCCQPSLLKIATPPRGRLDAMVSDLEIHIKPSGALERT